MSRKRLIVHRTSGGIILRLRVCNDDGGGGKTLSEWSTSQNTVTLDMSQKGRRVLLCCQHLVCSMFVVKHRTS